MYNKKKFSMSRSRIMPGIPSMPATIALSHPTVSSSPINPPRKLNTNSITKPKSAFRRSFKAHLMGVEKSFMISQSSKTPITT